MIIIITMSQEDSISKRKVAPFKSQIGALKFARRMSNADSVQSPLSNKSSRMGSSIMNFSNNDQNMRETQRD